MSDTPETDVLIARFTARVDALPAEISFRTVKTEMHFVVKELFVHARSLERRLHEAQHDLIAYAGLMRQRDAALREVEEHKSRCTVLEAEVAEWKSQFAAGRAGS